MGSSILTIIFFFFKLHQILKVPVKKGVITMNDSDDSHSCRERAQRAAQKDLDDPVPRRFYPAALDVIGRLANRA
jgi:hypothetical protein